MKPELRRCRMAEGCMMALRYGMVFFNLLFWSQRCWMRKEVQCEEEADRTFRSCVQSPLCGWEKLFLLPIMYFQRGCTLNCFPC
ncbi:hypothetical protein AMECASPLE_008508 [Ameca splendens]|uniref:Uncharacterized protein n=1 Tax=Ameca splendens TaxID=208324 RepID=A0ABV0ZVY4_9TELE